MGVSSCAFSLLIWILGEMFFICTHRAWWIPMTGCTLVLWSYSRVGWLHSNKIIHYDSSNVFDTLSEICDGVSLCLLPRCQGSKFTVFVLPGFRVNLSWRIYHRICVILINCMNPIRTGMYCHSQQQILRFQSESGIQKRKQKFADKTQW